MLWLCIICFFFFKQKTAYEMRISDWSSDVCSSDLHDGGAAGVDLLQQLQHAARHLAVEVAGRFVGKQDARRAGQCAGNGDALLLAAGEFGWGMALPTGKPDLSQRLFDALAPLSRREAAITQRQRTDRGRVGQAGARRVDLG